MNRHIDANTFCAEVMHLQSNTDIFRTRLGGMQEGYFAKWGKKKLVERLMRLAGVPVQKFSELIFCCCFQTD